MTAMFALLILTLVAAYMAVLFAIAGRSERRGPHAPPGRFFGPWAYALSLAIYCTSWTYYGAVGTAARDGWEYLPIYLGPILGIVVLFPIWRRIAAAAIRRHIGNSTTIPRIGPRYMGRYSHPTRAAVPTAP